MSLLKIPFSVIIFKFSFICKIEYFCFKYEEYCRKIGNNTYQEKRKIIGIKSRKDVAASCRKMLPASAHIVFSHEIQRLN